MIDKLKPPTKATAASTDDASIQIIYQGASQDHLMRMFKMDHRTAKRKIVEARAAGVKPKGRKGVADLYAIDEIAPYFCKPVMDPTEYIMQMDPRDLPKLVSKEFWAGQRSRQAFELEDGQLWRTERVVEEVGEILKMVKMSALLMNDALERQDEVTDTQRQIIRQLTRGMLLDLQQRFQTKFVNAKPEKAKSNESQEAKNDEDF